jgi:RNA polymerase sigma-70 factor (ECF subfamily)
MQEKEPGSGSSAPELNVNDWVRLYGDYLYNYATYRVNNEEEARDLVQDTFLSALKARHSFRAESSEKTWLVTILKHKIIDHYRKRSTQSIQQSLDSGQIATGYSDYFHDEGDHEGHWTDAGEPHAWPVNAYQQIESKEFYKVLNQCLSLLPQKWAAVFRLKNMEDVETEDICKELNVTPSNYWIIMHRAKLQLRKCMEMGWLGIK